MPASTDASFDGCKSMVTVVAERWMSARERFSGIWRKQSEAQHMNALACAELFMWMECDDRWSHYGCMKMCMER